MASLWSKETERQEAGWLGGLKHSVPRNTEEAFSGAPGPSR